MRPRMTEVGACASIAIGAVTALRRLFVTTVPARPQQLIA
jgi:hypothetical protein